MLPKFRATNCLQHIVKPFDPPIIHPIVNFSVRRYQVTTCETLSTSNSTSKLVCNILSTTCTKFRATNCIQHNLSIPQSALPIVNLSVRR